MSENGFSSVGKKTKMSLRPSARRRIMTSGLTLSDMATYLYRNGAGNAEVRIQNTEYRIYKGIPEKQQIW